MKIIIHIQPEELLVLLRDKNRVSIEHRHAWLNDMASMITPESRKADEDRFEQDAKALFGLRTKRPSDESESEHLSS